MVCWLRTDGDIKGPPAERQKIVFQKPILLRRSARKHFRFVCPAVPTKTLKPGLRMPIWNNRWTRTRISSPVVNSRNWP